MVATWGILGVLLLLGQASWRLGQRALEALHMGLFPHQLAVLFVWIGLNAYGEGYRAFQQRFSPRVVVRAMHLAHNPRPLWHALLAPFFCMAMFHATRRGKWLAWGTSIMVLFFIVVLRHVPQPWRGIVDSGVVVALVWGALAILIHYIRAFFFDKLPQVPSLLPETANLAQTNLTEARRAQDPG
jgi:hypothetical protein